MKKIFKFIRRHRISLWKTALFNFYCLPVTQAIKFPVWIYSGVNLWSMGKIEIHSDTIKNGMIRIGAWDFFPGGKFHWNNAGLVVFKGKCDFLSGSSITNMGIVNIGNDVRLCENLKIIIKYSLTIGDNTQITFGVLIMDTDFHYLVNTNNGIIKRAGIPIVIGKYNWIGNTSIIRKGTITSDFTIVATTSLLREDFSDLPPYSLLAGNPAKFISSGWRRIHNVENENLLHEYFNGNKTHKIINNISKNTDWDNFCLPQ
jgi:acetyltransferase-like isoleucine patch superfamily enzyme